MGNKRITDLTETTTPDETSDMVLETTTGFTLKSTIKNLLKRLFFHDDVYDECMVNAFGFASGGGNTTPVLKALRDSFYLWAFGVSAQPQEGFFQIHLPHDIKAGQDLTIHIHWTHNEAVPAGNVKWNMDYTVAKGYGAGAFGPSTTLSTVQAADAQYTHHITDDDDMIIPWSSGQIEPDSIILFRIWRETDDIDDTFGGDAFFLHSDLHYVRDRTGTKERNRPFTSGGF